MGFRILLSIFFIFSFFNCSKSPSIDEVKVMSFNIWVGGGKSKDATAQVITESEADIIGIQESKRDGVNIAAQIADSLGWYSYSVKASPTIISKYPIVDTSRLGHGVKIQLDKKKFVWMFNVHLMYCPYEAYQINGIEYCGAPILTTAEEAINSAWQTRGKEVEEVIADIKEAQGENYPIFLTGDFNEPSCLDWTERSVEKGLRKTAVCWPATEALQKIVDMRDSYRTIYPDEVQKPGYTWTTIPPTEDYVEIFDRIDFLFYWCKDIYPINSLILGEESASSDISFVDFPSDHRAVITTFKFNK